VLIVAGESGVVPALPGLSYGDNVALMMLFGGEKRDESCLHAILLSRNIFLELRYRIGVNKAMDCSAWCAVMMI